MTARFSVSVVFSLALASAATGCTVHTYSGSAYPATTYTRSEPVRYEVSHRSSERATDRQRGYAVPREDRHTDRPSRSRERDDAKIGLRDRDRSTAHDTGGRGSKRASSPAEQGRVTRAAKPAAGKPIPAPRPAHNDNDKDHESVTLKPSAGKDKYGRMRSFDERLGEVFEQKKAKIAREKKQRQARMERAVGAATDRHL